MMMLMMMIHDGADNDDDDDEHDDNDNVDGEDDNVLKVPYLLGKSCGLLVFLGFSLKFMQRDNIFCFTSDHHTFFQNI